MRTTLLSFFVTCLTLASGCSEDAQNLGGLSGAAGSGQATGGTNSGGTSPAAGGFAQAGGGQATGGAETGGTGQATGGFSQGVGGSGQATGGAETGGTGQATGGASTGGTGQAAGGTESGGFSQGVGGAESGGTGQATGGASTGGSGQATGGASTGGSGQATGGASTGGSGGASQGSEFGVRFLFASGQQTVGDFCVAYGTAEDGTWVWGPSKLLAASGIDAASFDGLHRMTVYVPLTGKPLGFGVVQPGQACQDTTFLAAPSAFTHYTVVAMPYSNEALTGWVVGDPVEQNALDSTAAGVRLVNATRYSFEIDATLQMVTATLPATKVSFGDAPTDYFSFNDANDHLRTLTVKGVEGTSTIDWQSIDLLPLRPRRTIYISGGAPYRALACEDTTSIFPGNQTDTSACFLVEGN